MGSFTLRVANRTDVVSKRQIFFHLLICNLQVQLEDGPCNSDVSNFRGTYWDSGETKVCLIVQTDCTTIGENLTQPALSLCKNNSSRFLAMCTNLSQSPCLNHLLVYLKYLCIPFHCNYFVGDTTRKSSCSM